MAENLSVKKLLEAGLAFTQMTQSKAEDLIGELVKLGQVQAEDAAKRAESLVSESMEGVNRLLDLVRKEVTSQLKSFNLIPSDAAPPPSPEPEPEPVTVTVTVQEPVPEPVAKKKAAAKRAVAKKAAAPRHV